MKYFSAFTGVGGFDLGMPSDWVCVGMSEKFNILNAILYVRDVMSRPKNTQFLDENGHWDVKRYKAYYNRINSEKISAWYYKNKERLRPIKIMRERNRRDRIKQEVLSHYSNSNHPSCVRCGFDDIRALTIDHINENGSEQRKYLSPAQHGGARFYKWLKDNEYPAGYQTLCMNCQFIKRIEHNREN